ncbi:structural maintenance of chromosomes 4 [Olea europaea subsp. europaea]|uniref:Structural maintenance of chromosomes 4 n=1 Tax=Olea europaea subsp. europaea TaxID=158383 RepID=A0A8S0UBF3_OLEEU|nr:structural maintenance of chromosomes 4 [Olea europaea subsp. europaea]
MVVSVDWMVMRWSQSIGSVEMVVMCSCGGGSSGGDLGDVMVVIGSSGLCFEHRCWIVSQCSQSVATYAPPVGATALWVVQQLSRIQKDLVDPEKMQATLADGTLEETHDLKGAFEMVSLLEAQLKEINPNLDSIMEYARDSGLLI